MRSLLETLQPPLQMKWHTSNCLRDHTPVKLSRHGEGREGGEMDDGNKFAGVKEEE